jgi:general secretion pathway protein A
VDLQVLSGAFADAPLLVVTGGDAHTRSQFCQNLVASRHTNTLTAHVVAPIFCDDDLLDRMLRDFGIVSDDEVRSRRRAGVALHQLSETLHRFLAGLVPLKARALLVVENAHEAGSVLEQIRQLAALEQGGHPLLQIVLVGSTDFRATLSLSDFADLHSRVTTWHQLPRPGLGGLLRAQVSLSAATTAAVVASVLAAVVAAALYSRMAF